jgi:hypothetical protein
MRGSGTDALTPMQGVVVAIFTAAISWFAVTLVTVYRDSGISTREVERLTDRISALESAARNCNP